MANIKWLSEDGLITVWAKIKELVKTRAAAEHTHAISEVTGLQDALDAKEVLTNKAASITSENAASTDAYASVAAVVGYVDGKIETSIPAADSASDDKVLSTKAVATALENLADNAEKVDATGSDTDNAYVGATVAVKSSKEENGSTVTVTVDESKLATKIEEIEQAIEDAKDADKYVTVSKQAIESTSLISGELNITSDNEGGSATLTVNATLASSTETPTAIATSESVAEAIADMQVKANIVSAITTGEGGNSTSDEKYTSVKAVVDYVDDRLSAGLNYEVCSDSITKPGDITSPVKGTIYLIKSSKAGTENVYDEFLYDGSAFEKIGTTQTDFSGAELVANKLDAIAETVTDDNYYSAKAVNAGLAGKVNTSDYLTTEEINTICTMSLD